MSLWETGEEREERSGRWQEARQDSDFEESFQEVHAAVSRGELSLAQVGGFSSDQVDAAYSGACKLLCTGKLDDAIQIAGYLILLQPSEPRFYYLAGLCFHHKRQYGAALQYYGIALAFADEPVTLIAKGEALLMLGRRSEALEALERGVQIAPAGDTHVEPHVVRATQLISTYLGEHE